MKKQHLFSLGKLQPQKQYAAGSRSDATIKELPILNGMALSLLKLQPRGTREPHWHPNANELSYCIEGQGLMTIFSPGAGHDTFVINPGDLVFVPRSYLHHIENSGATPLQMLVCFDHENPEDLNLSSAVSAMPDSIMASTFSMDNSFFASLKKNLSGVFITQTEPCKVSTDSLTTNRHKFNVDAVLPQVSTKGGWVKMSNQFLMPMLEGLSLYSVLLKPGGAREPHWHPNASELNYLIQGRARISILSPGAHVDTFDMEAGDLSFLPRGYIHYIENIGKEDARFAIFFNHTSPNDIGMSGCLGAYSNAVLASLFDVSPKYFDSLPKYQHDLFVVGGG